MGAAGGVGKGAGHQQNLRAAFGEAMASTTRCGSVAATAESRTAPITCHQDSARLAISTA